jgi:membrane protease YdiL (CAAX protease family)
MEGKLERKDLVFIGVCLVVTAISLVIGIHYFYQAFPEASIDFHVTREEAREQATAFLVERDLDLATYRHSAIFRFDNQTKTFLERELGLQGATQKIGNPVRLWRWSNRWVKELEKEEFRVDITTGGELVGFTRLIEEEAPGAHLDEAAARSLAENFLRGQLGRDPAALDFVEAEANQRPNRSDHTFTWKLRDFAVNEATYRVYVHIQGDQIGGFGEYLKVPEAWQREFTELRSRNQATGLIAAFFLLLTMVAMIAVFFGAVRRHDIRWKTAMIFGAIAAVLTLLAELNNLPLTEFSYDTTDTYGSFLTRQLFNSVLAALGQGIFIFFLTAAAEPLYRRYYGGQIQLGAQFSPTGLRTKRFLLGTILGLAMTGFFFTYQILFYITADKFGAWSPANIPYSEMVNTYIPWIMVLLIGFIPAVSEEFMSRAFSIPFLHKYLKSRWAAVFLSAVIWGFAHAGYPQQPFYIRGIEVGIAGIIIGFVFLRFGLLAPLVWHYTVDALWTALILLRSSNSYFVISAIISVGLMLLPLAVALVLYLRQRHFADPTPLLNERDIPPEPVKSAPPESSAAAPEVQLIGGQPATPTFAYAPLPVRQTVIVAGFVLASLGFFALDYERPLDFVDIDLTQGQAEEKAIAHLAATGVDAASYEIVTFHQNQPNTQAIKYILEREPIATVNRLYQENLLASVWVTRFFRYGEKEEYQVAVHPEDGSLYSMRHLFAEEAAGADLAEREAQAIALDHLRAFGLDPASLELKESSSEKLPARRDHRFVFEAREHDPRNIDELRYRVRVDIAGDQPANILRLLKVPEAWQREREESNAFKTTLSALLVALVVAASLHTLWLLVRHVRREEIDWAPLLKIAAIGVGLFLLSSLNGLSTFERGYNTRLTLTIFTITQLFGTIVGGLGIGLAIVSMLGIATSLYPDWPQRLRGARRSPELRDALWGVGLLLVANQSWNHLSAYVQNRFVAYNPSPGYALPSGIDQYLPLLGGLMAGLGMALATPIIAGILLYYGREVIKKRLYWILFALGLGLLFSGSNSVHAGEFYFAFANFLASLAFLVASVTLLLRKNLLAYVLMGFTSLFSTVKNLGELASPAYQIQAGALLFCGLLLIFYLWWRIGKVPPAPTLAQP